MASHFGRAQNYINRLREKYIQDYVFIHINKTGGSSIEKALSIRHEHKTAIEKRDEFSERLWSRRFSFSIVRNPWDKVVSHYYFRVMTNQTGLGNKAVDFKTWVRLAYEEKDPAYYDNHKMFMPQLDWLTNCDGDMLVTYVGKFEELQEAFKIICGEINMNHCRLPHVKKSSRGDFREYYNAQSAQIISSYFKKDIEYFGYKF